MRAPEYTASPMKDTAMTMPASEAAPLQKSAYYALKRIMDLALSVVAIMMLSPVFLLVAIAIKLDSKGPVFYSQVRIGKRQQPFVMYKFRSMRQGAEKEQKTLTALNERDGPAFKIANDPRLTRVGKLIRRTCIDELPQLINVIKGDMSIVGPRPPLPHEVERYQPHHFRRLDTTPGLTCYWQISNREMSFDKWVDMDIQYIEEASVIIDMKIILRTLTVLLSTKGDT